MQLYSIGTDIKVLIDLKIKEVREIYSNVVFEEYIVIPKLNNIIMLRFKNKDILEIDNQELTKREVNIRSIVSPDFLANFMGIDYKNFGLNLKRLHNTLMNCNNSLLRKNLNIIPKYHDLVEKDLEYIRNELNSSEPEIWELQIHNDKITVLYFDEFNVELYKENKIEYIPIKFDDSYIGIIKAEIDAINRKISLMDVLIEFQE
ncbi:MAG: hypothetical protein KQ78_02031 [Candidatus Izimaplasma bacterium HR2]|nr:MAG: hypothetical protein KQ78_02031 [Candidatus Izimaplasma bacterium HR2]